MGRYRFIGFLTDFGLAAESVGICKGVIKRINPEVEIVDISHGVPPFDVAAGALSLAGAVPYLPVSVVLAVVDPGVGSDRQALAVEVARGDVLVGPDNGLLLPAAAELGGIVRVHRLENEEYRLHPVSATFHARDVFAPAAAYLSLGIDLARLGPAVSAPGLVPAPWQDRWWEPPEEVRETRVMAKIIGFDQYGSARLDVRLPVRAPRPHPGGGGRVATVRVEDGGRAFRLPWVRTYSDAPVGEPCLLVDSDGRLLIAVNQGSAREKLRLNRGAGLLLTVEPVSSG